MYAARAASFAASASPAVTNGGRRDERLGGLDGDEKPERAGQSGGAVVLLGEADRDAHCEQDAEVREYGIAGSGQEGDVQEVGLAETKQESGDGQNGDGQHQRPTQLLHSVEFDFEHDIPPSLGAEIEITGQVRFKSARTSSPLESASVLAAICVHSGTFSEAMKALRSGMTRGATDTVRMPKPMKSATARGSDAMPPHTDTGRSHRARAGRRLGDQTQNSRMKAVEEGRKIADCRDRPRRRIA